MITTASLVPHAATRTALQSASSTFGPWTAHCLVGLFPNTGLDSPDPGLVELVAPP